MLIKDITEEELPIINHYLNYGGLDKHKRRLNLHKKGKVKYLIAWNGQVPVGHVLIKWECSKNIPMHSTLTNCSELEDLFVLKHLRCQGIGTKLIDEAFKVIKENNFYKVGISVSYNNPKAYKLYKNLGFEDIIEKYKIGGSFQNINGDLCCIEETCVYLMKDL